MTDTPNLDKLRYMTVSLMVLLDDPHPNLSTWRCELGQNLDKMVEFRLGDGFICWLDDNLELVDGKPPWMVPDE